MTEPATPIFLQNAPTSFVVAKTMAKAMARFGLRGSGTLFRLLERFRVLDRKSAKVRLKNRFSVFVPLYRPEHWDRKDLLNYEKTFVSKLVADARSIEGGITIVDCGADIGLISVLLADQLDNVVQIIAFEPSDEAFPVLERTLSCIPIPSQCHKVGVSDFEGLGALIAPQYDSSHHAKYLEKVESNGFPVTTIDSLALNVQNLILKIDVEGGELGVLRGAAKTIGSSAAAIVTVEAHPKVYGRTKIDPIVLLRELASIRKFNFNVAEASDVQLDISKPFFEQFPNDGAILNVICTTI